MNRAFEGNNREAGLVLSTLLSKAENRRKLKRIIALLSVVVLLFTTNRLTRKVNTLEHIPACGVQEHLHDETCYAGGVLVCPLPEHVHTDACYQQAPVGPLWEEEGIEIVAPPAEEPWVEAAFDDGTEVVTAPEEIDVIAAPQEDEYIEEIETVPAPVESLPENMEVVAPPTEVWDVQEKSDLEEAPAEALPVFQVGRRSEIPLEEILEALQLELGTVQYAGEADSAGHVIVQVDEALNRVLKIQSSFERVPFDINGDLASVRIELTDAELPDIEQTEVVDLVVEPEESEPEQDETVAEETEEPEEETDEPLLIVPAEEEAAEAVDLNETIEAEEAADPASEEEAHGRAVEAEPVSVETINIALALKAEDLPLSLNQVVEEAELAAAGSGESEEEPEFILPDPQIDASGWTFEYNDAIVSIEQRDGIWWLEPLGELVDEAVTIHADGADYALTLRYTDELELSPDGITELDLGLVTIRDAAGGLLPAEANGTASLLTGSDAEAAIQAVEAFEAENAPERAGSPDDPGRREYKVIGIDVDQLDQVGLIFQARVDLPESLRGTDYHLYHVHDDAVTEIADIVAEAAEDGELKAFTFETESFSVFVLSYTSGSLYDLDGKEFEYRLPGDGAVSLRALAEALQLLGPAEGEESPDYAAFMEDVENVTFSDEALLRPVPVAENTTFGALKEMWDLTPERSGNDPEAEDEMAFEAPDWALIALKPFRSEGALTVALKDGEVFVIRLLAEQSAQNTLTASGETYTITITYGEDAQIPDGAELKVSELLPEDEDYARYFDQAAAAASEDALAQGFEHPVISGARLFDIEIQGPEGKIEPAAPVQVDIRLADAQAELLSVVHFTEDGPETMPLMPVEAPVLRSRALRTDVGLSADPDPALQEAPVSSVRFTASSFSIYTVVNVTNSASLAGGSYALVTGIAGDPGATTGYGETWGRDYFTILVNAHSMTDQAFYDGQNRVDGLQSDGVHAWEDGGVSYVGGEPVQWTFEDAGNGQYYLKANGKYLQRFNKGDQYRPEWGWEVQMVENRNSATKLSIDCNNDGTVLIHDGGYYLHNDGNGEWNTRIFKFANQGVNTNSAAYRFRLCAESDAFDSFAARKVSVQDLTSNDSFLIYRKFEDAQGNEALYALAHDGTFVRVYDGGDTVYWRETDKNLYWNYLTEGNYTTIFTTDPATGERVYINPMDSSQPKQTITTTPGRLTLIGKDNGEYGTALENWDQKAYDYAGLHVTVNDQGVASLTSGTRVAGTSDTFLFAIASSMPGAVAETVDTVDSEALGIHITMYDYGRDDYEYNAGDKLDSMTNVAGSAEYTPHAAHALVKPYLESDLPSSTTKGAMTGLFTAGGSAVTYSQSGVTNLFLKSYYDESGTFRYRSEDNYAYLGKGGNTNFTVYRQAATPYSSNISVGHTYYNHGHYMPFNDIDMTENLSRLMNQYGNDYQNGQALGELPLGDGRSYEYIYGTQGTPNFYTGMKMEASFIQPEGGKLENGDDMIFKFTGDDDMWVYIDGVLVLDVGGIHEPLSGTINFATGIVTNPTGSSLAGTKTLYQIFMAARNASGISQEIKDKIDAIEWKDVNGDGTPDTFADYTNHDFKSFYMERGAGASNLDIQFNLKIARSDEFSVSKQIPDGIDPRFVNQTYKFRATFKDSSDGNLEKPLYAGAKKQNNDVVCTHVYYKDRRDENNQPVEVPVDDNGYFYLKAGETAIFKMADQDIEYIVKEVEIDPTQTNQVEINGQAVTVAEGTVEAAYARVRDRSQVNVKNHPFLQNLKITKHLLPEGTQAQPGDVFEFRVYLESTAEVDGQTIQQLVPYSYGPYYVTKVDPTDGQLHYFKLTGENNAPVDQGTTPVECSTTGRSGSINSIPPEYTVVIPNLAVGTHFYVEERRDNIPAGYTFDHEELEAGTYDEQTLGNTGEIISRILARDEKDHQDFDPDTIGKLKKGIDAESDIYNRKRDVTVEKQWLKSNGTPYTLEEARQLPDSTSAVITAELWKKKIVENTGNEDDEGVTVTFMVNTTADPTYRQVSQPITIRTGSALEFSLGAKGTSQAQEIHADPDLVLHRSSVTSNPKIRYSNGREKEKWSKYTINGIDANTTIYATFDAAKVGDDFVGLYIAASEAPGAGVSASESKVADITLNDGNNWKNQYPAEEGYTYFLKNVAESGLPEGHRFIFAAEPVITTNADGSGITVSVSNKYREPVDVTVEKVWSPALLASEETDAYIKVELHRYARKSLGVLTVVLKDNYGAPIEGAVFKLYKDGVEQEGEYTTDVNGKATANDLEPGTYYFKQQSTPAGYSMGGSGPKTGDFTVEDNLTTPQEQTFTLENQALETAGMVTLTVTDNNGGLINGAVFDLYKDNELFKSNCSTENGQIIVSQLKEGSYYFIQKSTPADYRMPTNAQTSGFTVLNEPGRLQEFTQSMTNMLRGRGTATVTLIGPNDEPIAGATFELYSNGEAVGTKTTDSNGQLTFGDPEEKLVAGNYSVKQLTSHTDLLPAAAAQSFTIYDNGNVGQTNDLTFTNAYRGKGVAEITLTRKDNGAAISGAQFDLYKNGVFVETKYTDSNGHLIFGDPVKLDVGYYYIEQITSAEGLATADRQLFEIKENGDPSQTYPITLVNDEDSVFYALDFYSSADNLHAGPYYFKSGTVVTVTFDNNNPYYNPYDGIMLSGDLSGTIGTGNRVFTVTMDGNKSVTLTQTGYSNWSEVVTNALSLSPEPVQSIPQNAQFAVSRGLATKHSSDTNESSSFISSASTDNDQIHNVVVTEPDPVPVVSRSVPSFVRSRAVPVEVNPSGPPSADYIVDSSFVETYRITKDDDNWQHVFENLDKADAYDNPYYYYVVEKECHPESYRLASYTNDNLTESGTITVTNELKKGELRIEKAGTVNGETDTSGRLNGTYTFTVAGVADTHTAGNSVTVAITLTNGVATAAGISGTPVPSDAAVTLNGSLVELSNLPVGTYTVTEDTTGLAAHGISVIGSNPQTLTVEETPQQIPTASFTNNMDLGSLVVTKAVYRNGQTLQPIAGNYTYPVVITVNLGGTTWYVQNANGDLGASAPAVPLTVSTDGSLSISDLPYGTYHVAELEPSNVEIRSYSYTIVPGRSVYEGDGNVSETPGQVDLVNIYVQGAHWRPEVTKHLNGTLYTGSDPYRFTLQLIRPEVNEHNPAGHPHHATLSAGTGKAIFEQIDYHHNDIQGNSAEYVYRITEDRLPEAQNAPYIADSILYDTKAIYAKVTVTKGNHGNLTASSAYYSDEACTQPLPSAVFDNTELGSLTVTKTVTGSYAPTNEDAYPFTVMRGEKYVTGERQDTTFTYSRLSDTDPGYTVKANETLTFENLPVGTYIVQEGDAARTGYQLTTTYTVSGENSVTGSAVVAKGDTIPVEITNHYRDAELTIAKTIAFIGEGNAADIAGHVSITVKDSENHTILDAVKLDQAPFTVDNGIYTATLKSTDAEDYAQYIVPDGTYTVTETMTDVAGYALKSSTYRITDKATTEEDDGTGGTLQLTADDTSTGRIDFTNTYVKLTDMKVEKTWGEGQQPPEGAKITFKLTGTIPGEGEGSDPVTLTDEALAELTGKAVTVELDGATDAVETTAWQYLWADLPMYDADGKPVTYSAEETAYTIGEETVDLTTYPAEVTPRTHELVFTNQIPKTEIKARKIWSQEKLPENTLVKLKIRAVVAGSTADIYPTLGVTATQEQTLESGAEDQTWVAIWSDLPKYNAEGKKITYYVNETEYKIGDKSYPVANPVTTPVGDYDFTFTNELPTIDVSVKKTWSGVSAWPDSNVSVAMTLRKNGKNVAEGDLPQYSTVVMNSETGEEEPDIVVQHRSIVLSNSNFTAGATWYGLPVYDENGQPIAWTVAETGMTYKVGDQNVPLQNYADAFTTTVSEPVTDENGNISYTIDNTPKETWIKVTKKWTLNGAPKAFENGQAITFDVMQKLGETKYRLTQVTANEIAQSTPLTLTYADGRWPVIQITKLPAYRLVIDETNTASYVAASYYPVETALGGTTKTTYSVAQPADPAEGEEEPSLDVGSDEAPDEFADPAEAAATASTITIHNKDYEVDIQVLKIDEETRGSADEVKLANAEFKLLRYRESASPEADTWPVYPDEANGIKLTDTNGALTFGALPDGDYRIVETKSPPGYVKQQEVVIYFSIADGAVVWKDAEGQSITDEAEHGLITYAPAVSGDTPTPASFKVGNLSGAQLPATGGPGEGIFRGLGAGLILLAVLWLILAERRRYLQAIR